MPLMGSIVDWTLIKKKISEIEDISIETSKTENQREKKTEKKIEKNIHKLWDNYKWYSIHVMGPPEGEERETKQQEQYLRQ